VAKTFQVRVWRELCDAWDALPEDARARISAMLPDDLPPGSLLQGSR
jgi:hypothetical protein